MIDISDIHQDLREFIYVVELSKDFELSEREIDNIVIEAAKDQEVYNIVHTYIENPSDKNNLDAYNNIVNTKLITIAICVKFAVEITLSIFNRKG